MSIKVGKGMHKHYQYIIERIQKINGSVYEEAQAYLDRLAKPPGSLGKLEETAARLCGISGSLSPEIKKRCVIVLAADNGVVSEGVASAPQAVTAIQTINMLEGVVGVNVLAKQFNTDVTVVDVGVNANLEHPALVNRKIRKSTGNIVREVAFSRQEAETAIEIGISLVKEAKEAGYQLIGVGEMGIGNTTTSSAVLAGLLRLKGAEIEKVVGKGAGLDDGGFVKKKQVIQQAIALHQPDSVDPIDVLHKVGGLDLATMTGVYLGAAYEQIPVVIDGFISVVAALCAVRLNPVVKAYLFASHRSFERGYAYAIEELGLEPSLHLDMRLGEGSGCPLMFAMMDGALAVLKNMATFEAASISTDYVEQVDKLKEATF